MPVQCTRWYGVMTEVSRVADMRRCEGVGLQWRVAAAVDGGAGEGGGWLGPRLPCPPFPRCVVSAPVCPLCPSAVLCVSVYFSARFVDLSHTVASCLHTGSEMGCFGSKDKLSKEDMDFLKSHTRYDEATIKEWYKGFKQDCPNGRLTPAKFVDMYKMFFPSGNAEEFCDHVFRTFDMDKNGYIDFKEFLLAIDVTSSGTPEEKLKWAFRMYDVDGNGVIDIQEMTKIVQAIYDMLGACSSNRPADSAEERAKNIFAKMDENNDGQLTQDEFLKGCLQDEELSKMLAP